MFLLVSVSDREMRRCCSEMKRMNGVMRACSAAAIQLVCNESALARLVGNKLANDDMAGQFQILVGRRHVVMRSGCECDRWWFDE